MSKRKIKVGDTVTVVQDYSFGVGGPFDGRKGTVVEVREGDRKYPYKVKIENSGPCGVSVHKVKRVKKAKVHCPIVGCDKTHPHLHNTGAQWTTTTVAEGRAVERGHVHWAGCYHEDVKSR